MDDDRENSGEAFLSRWSRVKREAKERPAGVRKDTSPIVDPKAPPPELPPVEKLTMDSDFHDFFHPKVEEDLRRSALKKLFSDPHFNVMDGLDVYIDDYSKPSPMPAAMLAQLRQAQKIIEWAQEKKDDDKTKAAGLPAENVQQLGDQPVPQDIAQAIPVVERQQEAGQDAAPSTAPARKIRS